MLPRAGRKGAVSFKQQKLAQDSHLVSRADVVLPANLSHPSQLLKGSGKPQYFT